MDKPALYNRTTKSIEYETTYNINGLSFLYTTDLGKVFNNVILNKRVISNLYGQLVKSRRSASRISKFIDHFEIDISEIKKPLGTYRSLNDFFTRELKEGAREVDIKKDHLISPADSRLFVFDLSKQQAFPVKGYWYSLANLVKDARAAREYSDGWCFIYRLAPADYHRHCYIDDGYQEKVRRIRGVLHSVHPVAISQTKHLMTKNYRELTVLQTDNFGKVLHLEVGALFVGKIVQINRNPCTYLKGDEKGWFEFGGSTIIQLFRKDSIIPDSDILEQTAAGVETIVKMGEKVGLAIHPLR